MADSIGPSSYKGFAITGRQLTGPTGFLDHFQSFDGSFGAATIEKLMDSWADETFLQKLLIRLSRCFDRMQDQDG